MVPAKIISGVNVISELGDHIAGKGSKALIVTDQFMVKFGNAAKVEDALKKVNIPYVIFDGANTEPTDKIVEAGLKVYREEKCDFIIALGGGSPMDTAKAIGFMTTAGNRKINTYMHEVIDMPVPYLVAIPTTAGTGSEVTKNTIISDTENNVKMLLGGPSIIPALAVVDPTFTMTAPPGVTAATGIDAFCHAIEAYTSRKAQPLTDTFAISAITKIHKNLPICYKDGKNESARLAMSIAALEAGIAFNNASVTIVHGMSRPIGALFHIEMQFFCPLALSLRLKKIPHVSQQSAESWVLPTRILPTTTRQKLWSRKSLVSALKSEFLRLKNSSRRATTLRKNFWHNSTRWRRTRSKAAVRKIQCAFPRKSKSLRFTRNSFDGLRFLFER